MTARSVADTRFPEQPAHLILSGPHFFVGNPFNKTPRRRCTQNSHYDVLDLATLPDHYLPRTNYMPGCEPAEYERRTPTVPWREPNETAPRKATGYYRVVNRRMSSPTLERTLITALVPPGRRSHPHNRCERLPRYGRVPRFRGPLDVPRPRFLHQEHRHR